MQWFSSHRHGFPDIADDGAASARLRTEHRQNTQLLRSWRQLEEWYDRRAAIVVSKGGKLTDEQREQIAFYDNQIDQLRLGLNLGLESDA